jgi:hypothetical protein
VTEAEIVIYNDVILDGKGHLRLEGDSDRRPVLSVDDTVEARLDGVFIKGFDYYLVSNYGRLTLTNSTLSGILISNRGIMTLINSAVDLRDASHARIVNSGTATLTNSTVSGSDLAVLNYGTLTLTNSTVSGSDCAIYSSGEYETLSNSLVVGGCDCNDGEPVISNGYNIESPGDTCGFDQEGDQVDVTEGQLNLGPLADNGGPTMTHALLPGSVAIDWIPADMCEVDEDQRGVMRPGGSMCDVGAYEVQP